MASRAFFRFPRISSISISSFFALTTLASMIENVFSDRVARSPMALSATSTTCLYLPASMLSMAWSYLSLRVWISMLRDSARLRASSMAFNDLFAKSVRLVSTMFLPSSMNPNAFAKSSRAYAASALSRSFLAPTEPSRTILTSF